MVAYSVLETSTPGKVDFTLRLDIEKDLYNFGDLPIWRMLFFKVDLFNDRDWIRLTARLHGRGELTYSGRHRASPKGVLKNRESLGWRGIVGLFLPPCGLVEVPNAFICCWHKPNGVSPKEPIGKGTPLRIDLPILEEPIRGRKKRAQRLEEVFR
jgi:hypothetical protein